MNVTANKVTSCAQCPRRNGASYEETESQKTAGMTAMLQTNSNMILT